MIWLLFVQKKYRDYILELFEYSIKDIVKLEIQNQKTQIFYYQQNNEDIVCLQEFNGNINQNSYKKKFEYLGFSFNGEYVYLKNSALANYYRKMGTGVRRCHFYSNHINNDTNGKIFQNRLHKQYSYIGASPSKSYIRLNGETKKWKKSKRKSWGNFIGYAIKASNTMQNNKIKNQIKNHWKILNLRINGKT